ncbi:hypothetical protein [Pyrobaculum sp.]|uniref:hypothetical protein n=1 Tax=Pyrobaculum sp. TaxID=2004705 RepID=UPI003162FBF3
MNPLISYALLRKYLSISTLFAAQTASVTIKMTTLPILNVAALVIAAAVKVIIVALLR